MVEKGGRRLQQSGQIGQGAALAGTPPQPPQAGKRINDHPRQRGYLLCVVAPRRPEQLGPGGRHTACVVVAFVLTRAGEVHESGQEVG